MKPSSYWSPIPEGWVPARGGHEVLSDELGRDTHHVGFTGILQSDGELELTWRSRGVNGENPTFPGDTLPESRRPGVIQAVELATGRKVRSRKDEE